MRIVQVMAVVTPRPIRSCKASFWRAGSFMLRIRMTGKAARMTSDTMEETESNVNQQLFGEIGCSRDGWLTSLYYDQILNTGFREALSRNAIGIPCSIDGSTLKDIYNRDGNMGEDEEDDQAVEEATPLLELGDAEEEHGDGEFTGAEGDEDLTPIEEVVLQESGVVVGLEVVAVPPETPEGFLHDEAHPDRVCHL